MPTSSGAFRLSAPAASRSFSVVPSRYSMTMNDRPSCSPMSWMVQMFGWLSADAVRASRANRPKASGSRESSSETNLRATGRPRRVSSALYTTPMPPPPSLLDDAVVRERLTDQRIAAGLTAVVAALSGELACGEIDRRSAEEPVGTVVCGEQRTDFFFQPLVAATRVAKIGVALYRGNVERGLQQLIDVIPAVIVHWRSGRRALDTTRLSRFSTPASR